MKKLAPPPARPGGLPREARHHRRAVRGRRPHRQGGARPGRGPAQGPEQPDRGHRERRRRRRHAGRGQGRQGRPDGYTLLLHHIGMATAPALYRNLPYKVLDDFEYVGMVNDVPMTLIGRSSLPASKLRRTAQVARGQQGQDQPRQRRPGCGVAPVRAAVPAGDQDRHDDRAVQGHRAGDDRPARRPGRHHVRPDHQHHVADRSRQGQGLRRDHDQAAVDAGR
jgi:hypothetical protein